MAEYSKIAKGNVTTLAGGGTAPIRLPFQPLSVKWWNYTALATPTSGFVASGYWDVSMGQGFSVQNIYNATPAQISSVATAGGVTTFEAGQLLQYGARKQIIGSTKTTNSFNVTAHGYAVGNVVVFEGLYVSPTTGMPQLSNIPFVVTTVTDANNFIVANWNMNQTAYTNLTGSPAGAYVQKVLYPYLYQPGVAFISALLFSGQATSGTVFPSSPANVPAGQTYVQTTAPNNYVVGQEVAFRIPAVWGTVELNSLPNIPIPGSPKYGYVTSVINSTSFVVNIDSTGYTAYNSNQAVAIVPGLTPPQVVAVGDVNTGGVQISAGSPLYPSPVINGASTINGPAILGAYVNNTSQGFFFGNVAAPTAGQTIYWEAIYPDYAVN